MPLPLVVEFTKMQGAGNDFLVVDNRFYRFSPRELQALAARWCPRRTGVGADGLLALDASEDNGVAYRMRYVNADGSPATMCGNGARCLARYAADAGLGGPDLAFATDAGIYHAHVPAEPRADVRLFVPAPRNLTPSVDLDRSVAGAEDIHYVWTGTEHLVVFVDDAAAIDVVAWGQTLRHDPALAPEGANVNVVAVEQPSGEGARLRVRTYEKGVEDETLACGTGVLAAATVAWALDRVATDPLPVVTAGGRFRVGHASTERGDAELYLEGPADVVFRGTMDVDPKTLKREAGPG